MSAVEKHVEQAFAALEAGALGAAMDHARRALAMVKDHPGALTLVGRVALLRQRPDVAHEIFERLLAMTPNLAAHWLDNAQALSALGEHERAVEAARKAVSADPASVDGYLRLGHLHLVLNATNEARAAFERALEVDPGNPRALAALADILRPKPGDAFTQKIELLLPTPALSSRERALLHYALARIHKDRDDAMFVKHLLDANRAQGEISDRHREFYRQTFDSVEAAFTQAAFAQAPRVGPAHPTPIFVLGMPRSGTSLVEQMLGEHPDVVTAGEINYMRTCLSPDLAAMTGRPFPLGFERLSADQLASLARDFRRRLEPIARGKRFVTDKTPGNFHLAGLLAHLFPDAPIIHTRRDPMDTCFSILQHPFDEKSPHTYDMALLGEHYLSYERIMRRWDELFPGRILTVQYEALVTDPLKHAPAIFTHCGLEWDERYLDFHRSNRAVFTFSSQQVRQPIYTSSIGGWKRYSDALAPLRAALGLA